MSGWTRRGFAGSLTRACLGAGTLAGALGVACGDGGRSGTGSTALSSTPGTAGTPRTAGFDWRRYAGQEIRLVYSGGRLEFYKTQVPEFERETGIKVQFDTPSSAPQLTLTEFIAGGSTIDGFVTNAPQDAVRYHRAKWYAPIDRLLADRSMTTPDTDLQDIFPGILSTAKVSGTDTLVGLPNESQVAIVYYNKQLFSKAGVPAPQPGKWTLQECEDYAKALHRAVEGVAGWSNRVAGSAFIIGYAKSLGRGWTNERGELTFNTPEHIQALDIYGRLLRLYGPDEARQGQSFNGDELFGRGGAAMHQEVNNRTARMAAVMDRIGYSTVPAGPRGAAPLAFSWSWAIYSGSKKQEAAWLWAQWITSKRLSLLGARQALLPSPRRSTYEDPEFKRNDPLPELTAVTMQSLQLPLAHGDWLPPVIDVPSARTALDQAVVRVIKGESARVVADEVTRELRTIQERT
ncbi:MAG: extracellular solute-binding protein [Chloroflexi bacterium]|nr:extracellular solute-binding protein [Chloroflexota bacterium]